MESNPTVYGTSSLASEPSLRSYSSSRSRVAPIVKWGAIACSAAALGALTYMHWYNMSSSSSSAVASTASVDATKTTPKSVTGWQSSYVDGEPKMMELMPTMTWRKKTDGHSSSSVLRVDSSKQFQEIIGFGGAFTEAASLQFARLPRDKQEEILTLYFDKEKGSGYEIGRVPMGSCDYSVKPYSFDDVENDMELKHFDTNVTHDTETMIPFIQRAMEKNPQLKMFLSPWSPPGWMKRADPEAGYTSSILGSAKPNGLADEYRHAWALYFSKFISAYKAHGIPFWGLTPQNEPQINVPIAGEMCSYTPAYEADFIANYLGPILKEHHPDVKIIVFDFLRENIVEWAETIFKDPNAKQYVDGIAIHWYGGGMEQPRYMDGVQFHEQLNDTHYVDPTRFILSTEAANCPGVAKGEDAWFRGQRYAHDIINDMNNWIVGWVDWNLILDHRGGPNQYNNFCDAPIIVDESGKDFSIQPMYYFIQHFSKYVPAGSRRIHSEVSVTFTQPGYAQLHKQYPVALHVCDNSANQLIKLTSENKLQVQGTKYCIDITPPHINLFTMQPVDYQVEFALCAETSQEWEFVNGQLRIGDRCLALNHGSTEDGVRIVSERCVEEKVDHQTWQFTTHGTLQSLASATKCATAGYASVQSTAFITPENKKVLVIVNENTEAADFELEYDGFTLAMTIPSSAIQTYTWE